MIVENINENNKNLIESFIRRIPSIETIESDVFDKIVIIRDENSVKGMISYEDYLDKGLIRYFIFQKDVLFEDLEKLFNEIKENAARENIRTLITVIEDEELVLFFKKLGFRMVNIDSIYLSETSLKNTIYSDALGMIYNI